TSERSLQTCSGSSNREDMCTQIVGRELVSSTVSQTHALQLSRSCHWMPVAVLQPSPIGDKLINYSLQTGTWSESGLKTHRHKTQTLECYKSFHGFLLQYMVFIY